MNGPLPEDKRFEDDMVRGSRLLLQSIENYWIQKAQRRPHKPIIGIKADVIWDCRGNSLPQTPQSQNSIRSRKIRQRVEALARERANLTATNREPCTRCGVRADIGCNHQRPAKAIKIFG